MMISLMESKLLKSKWYCLYAKIKYINRLNVAEKRIDKRINALGGKTLNIVSSKEKSPPTLIETLDDPHLLSCFVDYMDKDGRLPYLQLYMILSGIEDKVGLLINSDRDSWIAEADPLLIKDLKKLRIEFFLEDSVFIDINQVATNFEKCIQKLDSTKSLSNQSLDWLKHLKKMKIEVLRQLEVEYEMFIKSTAYPEHLKGNLDFDDEESAIGQYNDRYRLLLDDKDKFKKSFKLSNFFKKSNRKTGDDAPPSRKDGVENIEGELQSIIASEETIFGRIKKGFSANGRNQKNSGGQSSDSDTPGHTRKFTDNIFKMLPRSTTEPSMGAPDSPETLLVSSNSHAALNMMDPGKKDETANRKIMQLGQELAYLEEEINAIQHDDSNAARKRQLSLMKRGLQAELQQALMENTLMEKEAPDFFEVFAIFKNRVDLKLK
jgi:hypothetical protein